MSKELVATSKDKLIPIASRIIAGQPTKTVSARRLHEFLFVKRDFTTWIKARIKQWGFKEGVDYVLTFTKTGERKNITKSNYFLTMDMAKELSMVERNEKGQQARQYFIDCEKKLLEKLKAPVIEYKPAGFLTRYVDGKTIVVEIPEDAVITSHRAINQLGKMARDASKLAISILDESEFRTNAADELTDDEKIQYYSSRLYAVTRSRNDKEQ